MFRETIILAISHFCLLAFAFVFVFVFDFEFDCVFVFVLDFVFDFVVAVVLDFFIIFGFKAFFVRGTRPFVRRGRGTCEAGSRPLRRGTYVKIKSLGGVNM